MIDVSGLAPGDYIFEIEGAEDTFVTRLIVEEGTMRGRRRRPKRLSTYCAAAAEDERRVSSLNFRVNTTTTRGRKSEGEGETFFHSRNSAVKLDRARSVLVSYNCAIVREGNA